MFLTLEAHCAMWESHFVWQKVLVTIEWQAFCVVAKPGVAEESSVVVARRYSTYFEHIFWFEERHSIFSSCQTTEVGPDLISIPL